MAMNVQNNVVRCSYLRLSHFLLPLRIEVSHGSPFLGPYVTDELQWLYVGPGPDLQLWGPLTVPTNLGFFAITYK
jgi:hypothetical protein